MRCCLDEAIRQEKRKPWWQREELDSFLNSSDHHAHVPEDIRHYEQLGEFMNERVRRKHGMDSSVDGMVDGKVSSFVNDPVALSPPVKVGLIQWSSQGFFLDEAANGFSTDTSNGPSIKAERSEAEVISDQKREMFRRAARSFVKQASADTVYWIQGKKNTRRGIPCTLLRVAEMVSGRKSVFRSIVDLAMDSDRECMMLTSGIDGHTLYSVPLHGATVCDYYSLEKLNPEHASLDLFKEVDKDLCVVIFHGKDPITILAEDSRTVETIVVGLRLLTLHAQHKANGEYDGELRMQNNALKNSSPSDLVCLTSGACNPMNRCLPERYTETLPERYTEQLRNHTMRDESPMRRV